MIKYDKESYLKHLKRDDDISLGKRIVDIANRVSKSHDVMNTSFLDPHQINIAKGILNAFDDISYIIEGGYNDAERNIIMVYPEYLEKECIESSIGCIRIKVKDKMMEVKHSSILGSLMALGIDRDTIGDILVNEIYADVILAKSMIDYIPIQLEKVGKSSISIEKLDKSDMVVNKPEYEQIIKVIASMRLDAIVSALCNISRQEATKLISRELVKVNWEIIDKNSYDLKTGDLLSIRGYGRIFVRDNLGTTKKDNQRILFEKIV